jgi:transposase
MERAKNNHTRRGTNLKKEWQQHLKSWRSSGDTQVSYCQQHGLSRHAFQYWKQNLEGNGRNRFVEISRSALSGSGSVVEILLDGGVQIRVPQGVSPEHLHMVLQTLKEL